MKQEKLCESEDMTEVKDYRRWYADPVQDEKLKEELGADNLRKAMDSMGAALTVSEKPKIKLAHTKQIAGDHYKRMDIQPWDVVDYGPREQAVGFYRYNALKYIMRAGEKGDFKEDIAKAEHYLQKLLEIL